MPDRVVRRIYNKKIVGSTNAENIADNSDSEDSGDTASAGPQGGGPLPYNEAVGVLLTKRE